MTTYARIVQPGMGDKRLLVLLYLIHPDRDAAIREALGPKPIILARDDDGDPGPMLTFEEASVRHRLGLGRSVDYIAGIVLGGWSAGCAGVRKRLIESQQDGFWKSLLRGLILADGTHASFPPQAWQLDVWRPWIEKARSGDVCVNCKGVGKCATDVEDSGYVEMVLCEDCGGSGKASLVVFAASHTYQTYVEHLSDGKAYTSTVNVLRALTGLSLHCPGSNSGASEYHLGGDLHIESHYSKDIDREAHIRQQTTVLPHMLRQYIRPIVDAAPVPEHISQ